MPPIFTNYYYVNGLRDWCASPSCTAQDLAICAINNHTTRKVLFVSDITREWIVANIKPTYECAYISRVIESLLYIRLAGPKELESLLLSDAEDALLHRVEHLTLSAKSKAKVLKHSTSHMDEVENIDELNRVQYLIAADYPLKARQDYDGDIKLDNPSDHFNPPSDRHHDMNNNNNNNNNNNIKDYISLEDISSDHPDHPDNQINNKNNNNSNKDKGKDKKDDNQAPIPASGINIDSDMWRLHIIRLHFEVVHMRHRTFPEEPKIHVSFTQRYLRKLATIQRFHLYKTVEPSKAPPRPIVETFVPGSSAKCGHRQERKRLRMDRSGGGSESEQVGLEVMCKLFEERIVKKEEDERKAREIAFLRKWKYTASGCDGEGDDDDESGGDDDEEEENGGWEEDYGYGDIRLKDEKGDPDLEQSFLGMKRLRLEEDDDDDFEDKDQSGKDDHVQGVVEGYPEEEDEDL
ncbi:hypothetical protein BGZ82_009211 [Podila clonocystis]|nr:hypothetical protein BGZ82_009211 [Podila clonocystis]